MIRNIRLLYIHNFLTDFRFQEAFIVIFFAKITGSYTIAMSVLALATIVKAITDIPTGIFSDKVGRKNTLALGSFFTTLGIACYAFAEGSVLLLIGAVFSGLGQSLFSGNNNALLYETLKAIGQEDKYHHYQGRISSMFQFALGLSALTATIFTHEGLRFLFILGIIPQFAATIISLFFVEPKVHDASQKKNLAQLKQAFLQIYHNPRLRLLTIGQSISWGFGEAGFSFYTTFINSLWPTWAVALYRALTHALGFIGFWFAGPILDRMKGVYVLILDTVYGFVSGIIAIVMNNVITPIIFLSGALFFGAYTVASDQMMQQEFTDEQRATMGSVVSFVGSLVFAIAALCFGLISDNFGLIPAMIFGMFASVSALPVYIRLFRKYF